MEQTKNTREANEQSGGKKANATLKWVLLAAAVILVGVIAILYFGKQPSTVTAAEVPITEDLNDCGFTLDTNESIMYFSISFDDRIRYGLVGEDAEGLTAENTYHITEGDLGEPMGTIVSCENEDMIGRKAYHFAAYPGYDSICIAETKSGYGFYTADGISGENEIGQRSDTVLSRYGITDSTEKVEVCDIDDEPLFELDEAKISELLSLLAGKENTGLEANERRFAEAWRNAYGNDDVYYSEEDGMCAFRSKETTSGESLYKTAHSLWNEGERVLWITTEKGFRIMIDYFPSIKSFIMEDGYYVLSDSETEQMNALLGIE